MNPRIYEAVGVVLVATITYLGTRYAANRQRSGTIGTSESSELWGENKDFRAAVLTEAQRLRDQVTEMQRDAVESFNDLLELRGALDDAKRENRELRDDNHRLRTAVVGLEFELRHAQTQLTEFGGAPPKTGNDDRP